MLLNTTAPGAATPSFATQQTFATGSSTVLGDGGRCKRRRQARPDRRECWAGGNTVSVLLNTTPAPVTTFDGNSFATKQTFATGSDPYSVAAADVNGDGKPDLIVANDGFSGPGQSVDPSVTDLTSLDSPSTTASQPLGQMLAQSTLWVASDAQQAIGAIQTLSTDPTSASGLKILATETRHLATDRAGARGSVVKAEQLLQATINQVNLPVAIEPTVSPAP